MTARLLLLLALLAAPIAAAQPYTGFVVPTETPELDEEDAPPARKAPAKRAPPKDDDDEEQAPEDTPDLKPTGGVRLSDEPATRRPREETRTWQEQTAKARGPAVIEVNTAAPSVVTPEDLARDRRGTSLGGGDRPGGVGLTPRRDEGFYGTFRANDDAPAALDARELRELERRQKERGTPTDRPAAVPSGLLVAPSTPEEEEPPPEPPPRTTRPDAAPELRITGEGAADRFRDNSGLVPGAHGDGRTIRVEEFDTRTGIETEIVAPSSKPQKTPAKQPPPPRREPPPPPPTTVRVDADPPPPTTAEPEPPVPVSAPPARVTPARPAAAAAPAPTPAAPVEPDPFEKLERERAALEGRDYDAEQAAKKEAERTSRDAAIRELSAPSTGSSPGASPSTSTPSGPAGRGVGLSIGAGGGALVLRDATGTWAPVPAFGVNVTWVPSFAEALGIDVGFWRGGRSGGGDTLVDASWSHLALRAFLVKELSGGLRAGVGPGLLVTINGVTYGGGPIDESATFTRIGGDFTTFLGVRVGVVDVRLDLRAMLRGGLRLDFLPTLQAGVAF